MIHAETLGLVQGQQHPCQEDLVLFLQWESESVDDGAKNLKQLGNAIEAFGFIGELEKDVVDGSSNEGAQVEEFSINAMEGRLQKVSFARILRVEQLQKLQNEAVVDIGLGNVGVEILALNEAQEKLINNLDMWPGNLENGLILLWIKGLALRVHGGRDWAEQVLGKHVDDLGIHGLSDDLSVVSDIVEQLVQSKPLDLLGLHVSTRIVEVENDVALVNLLHKELLSSVGGDFMKAGQLLELAVGRNVKS